MTRGEQHVGFLLPGSNPLAVHERFAEAMRGPGLLEIVDAAGDRWPFHLETVRRVVSRAL